MEYLGAGGKWKKKNLTGLHIPSLLVTQFVDRLAMLMSQRW